MPKRISQLAIDAEQLKKLERLVRRPGTPQGVAVRARIILGAAAGTSNAQLARELRTSATTVFKWLRRWNVAARETTVEKAAQSSAVDTAPPDLVREVLYPPPRKRPRTKQPSGPRSIRMRGRQEGIRELPFEAPAPDRILVSDEPAGPWLSGIAGLYVNASHHVLLVSALPGSRSAWSWPGKTQFEPEAAPGRMELEDEDRDRASALTAALSLLEEIVVGQGLFLHDGEGFLSFLDKADAFFDPALELHALLDYSGPRSLMRIRRWFAQHPRCHPRLVSTNEPKAWFREVAHWFDTLDADQVQPGAFGQVPELLRAIRSYAIQSRRDPDPFQWIAAS